MHTHYGHLRQFMTSLGIESAGLIHGLPARPHWRRCKNTCTYLSEALPSVCQCTALQYLHVSWHQSAPPRLRHDSLPTSKDQLGQLLLRSLGCHHSSCQLLQHPIQLPPALLFPCQLTFCSHNFSREWHGPYDLQGKRNKARGLT